MRLKFLQLLFFWRGDQNRNYYWFSFFTRADTRIICRRINDSVMSDVDMDSTNYLVLTPRIRNSTVTSNSIRASPFVARNKPFAANHVIAQTEQNRAPRQAVSSGHQVVSLIVNKLYPLATCCSFIVPSCANETQPTSNATAYVSDETRILGKTRLLGYFESISKGRLYSWKNFN